MTPTASIVIPTRARPDYLEVALRSLAPQVATAGAEVVLVDDLGASATGRELAERYGARYVPHPRPLGINVARNTGVEHSSGALVVFVDDDVEVRPGWLQALLDAAQRLPDVDVFTGPIRPRLEGRAPRSCGREAPPITALDLGPQDTDARYAWGANMAVRRGALERVGPFDASLREAGDEQEWQDRLRRSGSGRVRYVAAAALDHRRSAADSRLRSLACAARARGVASRRFDAWRGAAPSLRRELATLAGCMGHTVRYRCPNGLVLASHSAGRVREALRGRVGANGAASTAAVAHADDFLSGASGTVGGIDGVRRRLADAALDACEVASGRRLRLGRAARRLPPRRRVLVLGVERAEHRALSGAMRSELRRSRHEVELRLAPPGELGKFENLNALLGEHRAAAHDWLLVVDDDVSLPRGFLDRFLFLAERFELALAQPAHRLASHAAWEVTRRQRGSAVRETAFVEIGPVTAFARATFAELLPFPPLRMGWGLDAHWAAIARGRGWRCGVVDAVAIGHQAAPAASAYSRDAAVAEARAFLADRPYLRASESQVTLTTHRRW